ncbi:MAG: hypothetical protein MH825_10765 [Cyanobacteria bacterium]|nr:hypothetical protein [Cyanobacteriota bacterium]
MLPIYLIDLWKNAEKTKQAKSALWGFLIIFSIPMLTSLPFLIWNAEGFFKSIVFSATRLPSLHIQGAPSIDMILSTRLTWLTGVIAKLPMVLLMTMTYLSFMKEETKIFTASAMTMMIFLYFNSVLFLQYFLWPLCLIPFALIESVPTFPKRLQKR